MSAVSRQRTCAVCGVPFADDEITDLEPLIDGVIRYVAVHVGHTTCPGPRRVRRLLPARPRRGQAVERAIPPSAA